MLCRQIMRTNYKTSEIGPFYLHRIWCIIASGICLMLSLSPAPGQSTCPALKLATELAIEADHNNAALEYRRLAISEPIKHRRAGFYWAAAYQYEMAGKHNIAQKMLDYAEDYSDSLTMESLLLRSKISIAANQVNEAIFYLEAILTGAPPTPLKIFATKRLAGERLRAGNISAARDALNLSPDTNKNRDAISMLDQYQRDRNRIPTIGGILGIIPGLGYAYSGEYANALRSLILNGIFIFAMVDTSGDDEWGEFGALTFFELTWFTGSIYGGIDAAHRYNQARMNSCINIINAESNFSLNPIQIPIISLDFTF